MFVDPFGLAVVLENAVKKNNGKYEEDEDGTVTVTLNGKMKTYNNKKVAGKIFVSGEDLEKDFNMPGWLFTPTSLDIFESEMDAAIAWGAMYNPISDKEGIEYQTYIYQNQNGKYYFGETFKGTPTQYDPNTNMYSRTVLAELPDYSQDPTAWAHTHGPYYLFDDGSIDLASNLFTGAWINQSGDWQGDGQYSQYLGLNAYVFTPGGDFKYLDALNWIWDGVTEVVHIEDSNIAVSVIINGNFPN